MTDLTRHHCRWCDYRHPVASLVTMHEKRCELRPVKAA